MATDCLRTLCALIQFQATACACIRLSLRSGRAQHGARVAPPLPAPKARSSMAGRHSLGSRRHTCSQQFPLDALKRAARCQLSPSCQTPMRAALRASAARPRATRHGQRVCLDGRAAAVAAGARAQRARRAGARRAVQHAGHVLPELWQGARGEWGPVPLQAAPTSRRRLDLVPRKHPCHRTARCGFGTRTAASPSRHTAGTDTKCGTRRWWQTTASECGRCWEVTT